MQKNNLIILSAVVLIVVAGVAFFAGMSYGKNQTIANRATFQGNFAGRTRTGAPTGGGFTTGSIIAKDSTSITLQLPNNAGSKIIFYSNTTQINKMASGTSADLANGTNVSITGTTNSDGSVTAQSIQIRPNIQNNNQTK